MEYGIPFDRLFFGNENWRSHRAIDEIEVYCDLLENLEQRIDSLETRGKDEEVTLVNVQSVISSYAVEIAMKSLWALDNSPECVPHIHNLAKLYEELTADTKESLKPLGFSNDDAWEIESPFVNNRYSMEQSERTVSVYRASLLRQLIPILSDKIEASRKAILGGSRGIVNLEGKSARKKKT